MTQQAEASSHRNAPVAAAFRHSFTCAGILYHCSGDWPDDLETKPDIDSGWPWLQQLPWFVQLKNFQQKNRIKTQYDYLLLRIFRDQQLVAVLPLMSANQQRTLVALSNYYSPEFKPLQ